MRKNKYPTGAIHNTKESAIYSLLQYGRCSNCAKKTSFNSRYDNEARGNSVAQLCMDQEWDSWYTNDDDNSQTFNTFSDDSKRTRAYDPNHSLDVLRRRRAQRKTEDFNKKMNKYLRSCEYCSNENLDNNKSKNKKTKRIFSSYCSLNDLDNAGIEANLIADDSYCSNEDMQNKTNKRKASVHSYCSEMSNINIKKTLRRKKKQISKTKAKPSIKRQNSYCSEDSLFNGIPLNESYISELSTESEPIPKIFPYHSCCSMEDISMALAERDGHFSKFQRGYRPDDGSLFNTLGNIVYGHTKSMPLLLNRDASNLTNDESCESIAGHLCVPVKKPNNKKSKSVNTKKSGRSKKPVTKSNKSRSRSRIIKADKLVAPKKTNSKSCSNLTINNSQESLITRSKRAASRSLSTICKKCFPCFLAGEDSTKSENKLSNSTKSTSNSRSRKSRQGNSGRKYKCSCNLKKSKSTTPNSKRVSRNTSQSNRQSNYKKQNNNKTPTNRRKR